MHFITYAFLISLALLIIIIHKNFEFDPNSVMKEILFSKFIIFFNITSYLLYFNLGYFVNFIGLFILNLIIFLNTIYYFFYFSLVNFALDFLLSIVLAVLAIKIKNYKSYIKNYKYILRIFINDTINLYDKTLKSLGVFHVIFKNDKIAYSNFNKNSFEEVNKSNYLNYMRKLASNSKIQTKISPKASNSSPYFQEDITEIKSSSNYRSKSKSRYSNNNINNIDNINEFLLIEENKLIDDKQKILNTNKTRNKKLDLSEIEQRFKEELEKENQKNENLAKKLNGKKSINNDLENKICSQKKSDLTKETNSEINYSKKANSKNNYSSKTSKIILDGKLDNRYIVQNPEFIYYSTTNNEKINSYLKSKSKEEIDEEKNKNIERLSTYKNIIKSNLENENDEITKPEKNNIAHERNYKLDKDKETTVINFVQEKSIKQNAETVPKKLNESKLSAKILLQQEYENYQNQNTKNFSKNDAKKLKKKETFNSINNFLQQKNKMKQLKNNESYRNNAKAENANNKIILNDKKDRLSNNQNLINSIAQPFLNSNKEDCNFKIINTEFKRFDIHKFLNNLIFSEANNLNALSETSKNNIINEFIKNNKKNNFSRNNLWMNVINLISNFDYHDKNDTKSSFLDKSKKTNKANSKNLKFKNFRSAFQNCGMYTYNYEEINSKDVDDNKKENSVIKMFKNYEVFFRFLEIKNKNCINYLQKNKYSEIFIKEVNLENNFAFGKGIINNYTEFNHLFILYRFLLIFIF